MNLQLQTLEWPQLGDLAMGRPNLGINSNVMVYRLMQMSLRKAMEAQYGVEMSNELFFNAGKIAGSAFCISNLNIELSFYDFIANIQQLFKDLGVGILRIEESDELALKMVLTIEEDLDCSGTPVIGRTLCQYDEGLLTGIFESYTGKSVEVREIECWGTGHQICRFVIQPSHE